MISLYIHIPFCIRKCAYCDFLSFPSDDETIQRYLECLCNEIELSDCDDREVKTIFIGGGTPSILSVGQITFLMDKIKSKFNITDNCEITIECNPGTASEEKLAAYFALGINRLSIGLQSANDKELQLLGRIHDYNQFKTTYNYARRVGFKNINIDLMSALPGQNIESYRDTLTRIVTLKPEHVSAYSLIIEEGTKFWDLYGDDASVSYDIARLPDEDAERAMYYLTEEVLDQAGYHRYEISNYARDGFECEHNKTYWTGGDYISFGIGAASFYKGIRYNNISDVTKYMEIWSPDSKAVNRDEAYTDKTILTSKDMMEEYMFVGLRLITGVSISGWKKRFGCDIMQVHGEAINRNIDNGLLEITCDNIRLTPRGIDLSNVVLADFLLD